MQKDDVAYLRHMIDMASTAVHKVERITREQFDGDENLRLAVTHLVQTVGEAARRLSREFQERHPTIPWDRIVGMRHKIVHDYLHVDYDIVWDVATRELPPLVHLWERMVQQLNGGP